MRKGVIYKLTSPSLKVYIGQTWNFYCRMSKYTHLHCKGQVKLYSAIKKYGFKSFTVEILEECSDQNEMNSKEIMYIKQFDSYLNGYNSTLGGYVFFENGNPKKSRKGIKRSEETKKKISLSHRTKQYEITYPDGRIIIVDSLSLFCRENNLNDANMFSVSAGKREHCSGYKVRKI